MKKNKNHSIISDKVMNPYKLAHKFHTLFYDSRKSLCHTKFTTIVIVKRYL